MFMHASQLRVPFILSKVWLTYMKVFVLVTWSVNFKVSISISNLSFKLAYDHSLFRYCNDHSLFIFIPSTHLIQHITHQWHTNFLFFTLIIFSLVLRPHLIAKCIFVSNNVQLLSLIFTFKHFPSLSLVTLNKLGVFTTPYRSLLCPLPIMLLISLRKIFLIENIPSLSYTKYS